MRRLSDRSFLVPRLGDKPFLIGGDVTDHKAATTEHEGDGGEPIDGKLQKQARTRRPNSRVSRTQWVK
jgi:hypothetical protein